MSKTSTIKRKRNVLSIETKIQIINRLEKGESGASLAKIFQVGNATISDIKNKKDAILKFASQFDSEDGSKKRKTMKKPVDEKLDEAVYLWFVQKKSKGEHLSGPLVCEKAIELNIYFGGPPDFKASTGWLKNFKSRHGILELEVQGERIKSDTTAAEKFKDMFLALLKDEAYSPDDVYNVDEIGLNCKSLPCKSIASNPEILAADLKASNERVTIMVAANATGSHSLPLFMIGKSVKFQCFINEPCLPLCKKTQKNGWVNSEIFFDWYRNEFMPNVKKFREQERKTGKVLLLTESAPCRPEVERLNAVDENFKVIYLPTNVTALIQPTNQAIIERLKNVYKKQVLRRLFFAEEEFDTNMSEDLNEIVEKFQANPGFSDFIKNDPQKWLENYDSGFQILSDDDIASFLQEEQQAPINVEVGKSVIERKIGPSHEEAFIALETVLAWFEHQEESCPTQLLLLNDMRDLAAKKRKLSCSSKRAS